MHVLANVLKTVNSVPNLPITKQVFKYIRSWMMKVSSMRHAKLKAGAIRFSIVTSGRNTNNPNEFNQIIRVLDRIKTK